MAVEKIKIPGAVLELPAKQPILPDFLVNKWAKLSVLFSSKTDPRILTFSSAMGAKPSFYMKFIDLHFIWNSLLPKPPKMLA